MNKLKSLKLTGFLTILKCCLIGIVTTLVGIVVFAIALKFTNLNSTAISWVNDIIKGISLFFVVFCLKKKGVEKLPIKSAISGLIYAILSFVIFSILNGGMAFGLGILYDIIFAVIVAVIASIILNLVRKN